MEAFDLALRAMVLSRAISSDAERHSHFVSFTDSAAGSRAFTSPLQDWSTRRSSIVVTRIGRVIDGKSIDDVIEMAARERQALEARMQEWRIRQSHGPDMTWTQPDTPPLRFSSGDDAVLDRVQISGVSLARVQSGDGDRTILSFLIENLSDQPVRSITLANRAEAQTREIEPEAAFHYVMPTPLAPGARRRIMTAADLPASLSREIRLVGMEDGAGRRTGAAAAPRAVAATAHAPALCGGDGNVAHEPAHSGKVTQLILRIN